AYRGAQADGEAVGGEEAAAGQALPDAAGDCHGAVHGGDGQQERELVPAEPRNDVRFACAPAQDCPDLHQRAAASHVSVRVVDVLEAVEVEEEQRHRLAAPKRTLDFAPQRLVQVPRIVEPGQVVDDR